MTKILPKYSLTGCPVRGNGVFLPATQKWQDGIGDGAVIVGRDPFSSRKLQVIESQQVVFASWLNELSAIQYTLTGLTYQGEKVEGEAYKGLLGIVKVFPAEFADCDIVLSAKDLKLSQAWKNGSDKKAAQNPSTIKHQRLNGMLVVKDRYDSLVGISPPVAEKLGGDWDGDSYPITPAINIPCTTAMVRNGSADFIPNPKPDKGFTPRTQTGNFQKILDLRKPLLEKWVSVSNVFNALSPEDRKEFADRMMNCPTQIHMK